MFPIIVSIMSKFHDHVAFNTPLGQNAGPFASQEELAAWLAHKCDVNRRMRHVPPPNVSFDFSLPLVLTHLDLHPQNIILDTNHRLWIIDWEFSGFYPQWFEYAVMRRGWDILGPWKWRKWPLSSMAGFCEKQAILLLTIA